MGARSVATAASVGRQHFPRWDRSAASGAAPSVVARAGEEERLDEEEEEEEKIEGREQNVRAKIVCS